MDWITLPPFGRRSGGGCHYHHVGPAPEEPERRAVSILDRYRQARTRVHDELQVPNSISWLAREHMATRKLGRGVSRWRVLLTRGLDVNIGVEQGENDTINVQKQQGFFRMEIQ